MRGCINDLQKKWKQPEWFNGSRGDVDWRNASFGFCSE